MLEKLTKIIAVLFSIIWATVIFTEYWHYNPNYSKALEYFQYTDLLVVFTLLGVGMSWGLATASKKKKKLKFINGLTIFGLLLLLDVLTISFYFNKMNGMSLTSQGLFSHLGHFIGVAFCVYLIYLVCRVAGTLLTAIFPPKISKEDSPVIQTALGIMLITFLLFIFGIFHLLYLFVIAPMLLALLLFNWQKTFQVVKATLFRPIDISPKFNAIGVFSFLFLAAFLVFDFVQILRPFPLGTDSINLYVNLPTLIAEYAGLVDGYQPYNWSLFMSLGLIVFGRVDVVLALSFLGGVLTLFALYRLGRKWLDVNYTMLCLLLFFSTPMINFLLFMDMKIDLGLLYFTLCMMILFVNWVSPPELTETIKDPIKSTNSKKLISSKQKNLKPKALPRINYLKKAKAFFSKRLPPILIENKMLVLMGVFAGFALGIKMTTLLVFFALMAAIWYKEGGIWSFFSAAFLMVGVTFILRLDDQALLRQYHQNVSIIQWVLLAVGLGLAVYTGINNRKMMLRLVKISLITSVFFLLPILPWFGKNYVETKSFTTSALLNGKKAIPQIDLNTLENKWKEVYE